MTKSIGTRQVKHTYLALFGAFIVLLLVVCVSYRYKYVSTQQKLQLYEKSYVLKRSSLGDIMDTKQFSFTAISVEFDTSGVAELPPAPGMQFVMVSISIFNKTDSSVNFLPVYETYMRDASGARYEISTAPKIEAPSIAGQIERATGYNGVLGFMVPKDAIGLEFIYEPRAFPNSNTIIYGITD